MVKFCILSEGFMIHWNDYVICVFNSIYVYGLLLWPAGPTEARSIIDAGVISSHKGPDVGAKNWTQAFSKSSLN